jgi:hypothetical protein
MGLIAVLGLLVALGVVGVVWVLPAMTSSESEPGTEPGTSAAVSPAAATPAADPAETPDVEPIATTGAARIVTEPAGATIIVDDLEWPEKSPTTVDGLDIGKHELKLVLEGHDEKVVELSVAEGVVDTVEHTLTRAPATPAAVVTRKPAGKRPGKTRVTKRRPGKKPAPAKQPAKPAGKGTLRIVSEPSCEVIVDGKARGSTPIAKIELSAGKHRVQLINSRFGIDRSYTVEIKPGEVTKKRYNFPID